MKLNNSPIPLDIKRPVLVYYVGYFENPSIRIFHPEGYSDMILSPGATEFIRDYISNSTKIDTINKMEILHWEYL